MNAPLASRRAFLLGRLRPDGGGVVLDPGACLAGAGVVCTACAAVCPESAIRFEGRRPTLIPSRCTGCGDCIQPCPTGAWRLPERSTP